MIITKLRKSPIHTIEEDEFVLPEQTFGPNAKEYIIAVTVGKYTIVYSAISTNNMKPKDEEYTPLRINTVDGELLQTESAKDKILQTGDSIFLLKGSIHDAQEIIPFFVGPSMKESITRYLNVADESSKLGITKSNIFGK